MRARGLIAETDQGSCLMLRLARDRQPVIWSPAVGVETVVTLLYWRNRRARIRFQDGSVRTVDTAHIQPTPKGTK